MPAIKISLNRLIELFGRSVNNEELPMPVRALAARLMTLTAHTSRVEQKVDASHKALSDQISQLTDLVHVLAQQQVQVAPATTPTVAPSADGSTPPAAAAEEPSPEASNQEDDEAAFFAKAQREAEAEVAAINNAQGIAEVAPTPAPVVALARGKKAGGVK